MQNKIEVIFENEDFLIINKPSGLLVHPVVKADPQEPALTDWLLANYPQLETVGDEPQLRPGIVHRLDKETSGVLVVAKNQKTFEELKNLFQTRQIEKTYLALVIGQPAQNHGIIDLPIAKASKSTKRTSHVKPNQKSSAAITVWSVKKVYSTPEQILSLLKVKPRTGRTHQIRVHLAAINHPVVGDYLYGGKATQQYRSALKRTFLHAHSLKFKLGQTNFYFEAELPAELQAFLDQLG